MANSVNTFSELNTDSHPVNTQPNVMTDAINATLTTKGENQLILQNMEGNHVKTTLTEGFKPLGVEVFNDIAYIISGRFDSTDGGFFEGEIGTFPSPDWNSLLAQSNIDPNFYLPLKDEYAPLYNFSTSTSDIVLDDDVNYTDPFRTQLLNFISDRLIEVEVQPSYDESVNIIFTDDYNPPRLVNSRFRLSENGKQAAIADRRQDRDTNTYSNQRFGGTRLIRQANKIPDLEFLGVQTGGILDGGDYKFYFRYTDSDGALTDLIEESRTVAVAYNDHGTKSGDTTDKMVKFKLSNLDKTFSGVRVYYSKAEGETSTVTTIKEISNIYDIGDEDEMFINIYGSESTSDITSSNLNIDYSSIHTVKTMTQYNDRLLFGNITSRNNDFETLKELAQRLRIEEVDMQIPIKEIGTGYADPDNVYHNLGYWAGETYEVGIVFILKEGQGTTPALPIRGGDNYEDNFSYTGITPITTDDGYKDATSSENRLGVYRTNKCRTKLTNGGEDTMVRYFRVNVSSIRNHPYIVENTDGFFFVRKTRKKDAIIQGYICNAFREPIMAGHAGQVDQLSTGERNLHVREDGEDVTLGATRVDWHESNGTILPIWNGIGCLGEGSLNGVYAGTTAGDKYPIGACKILPAPGRMLDFVKFNKEIIPQQKTYQGAVNGLSIGGVNDTVEGSDIANYWSFYASDMLVDAPLFASIFNNESKGMMVDQNPVIAKAPFGGLNIAPPSGKIDTYEQVLTPYTYAIPAGSPPEDFYNPNGYNFVIFLRQPNPSVHPRSIGEQIGEMYDQAYDFVEQTGNPDILETTLQVEILGQSGSILDQSVIAELFVQVDISNTLAPTVTMTLNTTVTGLTTGISVTAGGAATGTMVPGNTLPNPSDWQDADHGSFSWIWRTFVMDPMVGIEVTDNATATTFTQDLDIRWEESSWDMQVANLTLNSTADVNSVKELYLESHTFCPEPMTDPSTMTTLPADQQDDQRKIYMSYVLGGQDGFSNDQFASRSDRNLFYGLGTSYFNPVSAALGGASYTYDPTVLFTPHNLDLGFSPTGLQDDTITDVYNWDPEDATATDCRMAIMWQHNANFEDYVGVRLSIWEPQFLFALHNDWDGMALNLDSNSSASSFVERFAVDGVRLAAQVNVYNSPSGVISPTEWKLKYSNSNIDETYHAITKRFRWDDPNFDNWVNIFGGDCFMTYTYKRISRPLGVPGVETAQDWKAYHYHNRAPGLIPHGIVFPMVQECNYNTALRAYEFYSAEEKVLYGKDRSFYPLDEIDALRSSKQPESHGYNHGYTWVDSDRVFAALNDRAPSLNINYGNRVMVSAPAIAGNFFNGYTDFSGLNYRDYNKQLGEITAIITHGDYAYCIFEAGVGVIPINQRTMVTQQTGGVFLDDAEVLAQKMQIISSEYGSDQQFSVIKTDEYVYGVDFNKNKVWRIVSQGGGHRLELISDFAIQSILNVYKERLTANQLSNAVKTNYDRERNNVIFSYYSELFGNYVTDFYQLVEDPNPPVEEDTGTTIDPDEQVALSARINNAVAKANGNADGETAEETAKRKAYVSVKDYSVGQEVPADDLVVSPDDNPDIDTPSVENEDGELVPINETDPYGNYIPQLWRSNDLGTVYWNETLNKWISRLSWNPLWTFNLESKLFSFNALADQETIWEHFSQEVPHCHFYGHQEKFVFEFVIVDNSSAQKILNNLMFICNREFPGRITYGLLENDFDYELTDATTASGLGGQDNGYTELLKQRQEPNPMSPLGNGNINAWDTVTTGIVDNNGTMVTAFTMSATNGDPISQEESERIVGGYMTWNGVIYIIGPSFESNGVFYNEVWDQNGNNIAGALPATWDFNSVDFGIIQQNMEYNEDHLYIEVGQGDDQSRVRDKAIRVRVMYEGYNYYTIQAIISNFVYSFG